jgi:hypothetical protein
MINAIDLTKMLVIKAFDIQVSKLKNPPESKEEIISILNNCQLINTAEKLKKTFL